MKTEAKIFKSHSYNQVHGTGGGPLKKMNDRPGVSCADYWSWQHGYRLR